MIRFNLDVPEYDNISKNITDKLHNMVNITKDFIKEGYTSHGRSFHSTFALEHNKVLNVGFNDYRRSIDYIRGFGKVKHFDDPIATYNMCLHSEIDSILKLNKDIDYSAISFFNVRIDKNYHCKESRPCPNCLYTLLHLGAKRIYFYSEKDKKFKYIKL